jgi:extradiol dioxygenase family protein
MNKIKVKKKQSAKKIKIASSKIKSKFLVSEKKPKKIISKKILGKKNSSTKANQKLTSALTTNIIQPFHLAIPVNDLVKTREFYGQFLGFEEGRSCEHWIDWNFFNHQLVTHLRSSKIDSRSNQIVNQVDDHGVPVPHFGVVLTWDQFNIFSKKLKKAKVKFVIEPYIRFKGQIGEQATMFFYDPSGNALEFKAFKDISQLFRKFQKN